MNYMVFSFYTIVSLLFSSFALAGNFNVSAKPNEFLIRSGDLLTIEAKIDSNEANWIKDVSSNSKICQADCQQSGLDLTIPIYVYVKGEGNISIGPYELSIGSETIRTNPIKIVVLPPLNDKEGVFIKWVTDPNGSGKFQIRIDYRYSENELHNSPIVMNKKKFLKYATGTGLVRHRSSSSSSSVSGSATYILENTTTNPIRIYRDYFMGLPEKFKLPEIIIPSSKIN